jgi:hypothetical protein
VAAIDTVLSCVSGRASTQSTMGPGGVHPAGTCCTSDTVAAQVVGIRVDAGRLPFELDASVGAGAGTGDLPDDGSLRLEPRVVELCRRRTGDLDQEAGFERRAGLVGHLEHQQTGLR